MAYGGGTYTTQNKILPGAYINFVSAARATAELSARGTAAMLLPLPFGPQGVVTSLKADYFAEEAPRLFGCSADSDALLPVRELFRGAETLLFYRPEGGEKAQSTHAAAKYAGTGGNQIQIVIRENAEKFDVVTVVDGVEMDSQTVSTAEELLENDFVTFTEEALSATAGEPLTGGTDKEPEKSDYEAFLRAVEPYTFQTLGCASEDSEINELFVSFTRRMREESGVKFQTVLYRTEADYEGVISVENEAEEDAPALVYWMTGAAAGCAVNASCSNKIYDGEYTVLADYTQAELEEGLKAGKLMFHRAGGQVRVLSDVNTLTTFTNERGEDFALNQTVRVLDQIANDVAVLFCTRYLGQIPNDEAGRISLWNDIVKHHQELERQRAIENFSPEDVQVSAGQTKRSVVVSGRVTPVCAMEQLYMTVTVPGAA